MTEKEPEKEQDLEATNERLRLTAEIRRFNNFIEAARRLECDQSGQLFRQAFQKVISAGQSRSGAAAASRERTAGKLFDINALGGTPLGGTPLVGTAVVGPALGGSALGGVENQ